MLNEMEFLAAYLDPRNRPSVEIEEIWIDECAQWPVETFEAVKRG